MSPADRILPQLSGVRQIRPGEWTAKCPAHDDRSPSLSIREAGDKLLLRCWSGCETKQILVATGNTWSDLFDNPVSRPKRETIRRRNINNRIAQWRERELFRAVTELRRRDSFISAFDAAYERGAISEDQFFDWLAIEYSGYSELEHRFEILRTGTPVQVVGVWDGTR